MTGDADLLIAGGGPAGLATALYALRAGLQPMIVEPRSEGTDKACGEGLMPSAVRALDELGVSVPGQPISGIRYVQDGLRVAAEFRDGTGLGVRRTVLHTALHRAAVAAGVPIRRGRVTEVRSESAGVVVPELGLRGRWLVAADGLHSPVARGLGLVVDDRRAPRFGLRRHFAVAPGSSSVEVHHGPHGEAYLTPVGPELTGVALLTTRRAPFGTQLAAFPALAQRFTPELAVTAVRGAGPLRRRVRRRVADRVLLVGDAAGYVDAITGEGIALALSGAAALVDCLRRGRPQDYEAVWRRATRRHRLLTELLVAARTTPLTANRIVPAARRFPSVFAAVVNALA
ncbi:NAD(P)/FAD-dependent oxidoreductase [Actinoalloteichus hymeniacidonis]|uniref:Flavin-dependent dehydrogenase n=1 Tax=Actinoalloteichus hymeniacidonis TaxID=340345 RepID=A0AAC9HQG7_9PSEU|nr:NAD(P)/FAD-dependent oxidoreductase [Actinoalloteichus hymeniacidonis]AOS63498.1 flavin-dependent dehydrogenase [Actinoalloteichus hymeniacidonis]MBB5908458.1 flavin-dependent dehydrogenase [Actinoalloteichus hymeniacidonis]